MRILTVRQPWAGLIAAGIKPVENRPQNIAGDYRGPVAIHSAKTLVDVSGDPRRPWTTLYQTVDVLTTSHDSMGAIVCVVDLWAVHQAAPGGTCCPDAPRYRTWAEPDCWHLCISRPRPLPEPIPYKGALGLRTLPDEVEALIWARLEAS